LAETIPQQLSVVNEHNTRFCALLATLHIPLVAGRIFTERDAHEGAPVVIINNAMAFQFWPDEELLGRQMLIAQGASSSRPNGKKEDPCPTCCWRWVLAASWCEKFKSRSSRKVSIQEMPTEASERKPRRR
jgi:hypothetical protein